MRNMTTTCEALSPRSQEGRQPGMSHWMVKRILDLTVASVALVLVAPLLAAVSVSIRFIMGGPVLFRQLRLGRKDRPFYIVKFRTMKELRDPRDRMLPDAERLTPFGRYLRALSIDELPQLWTVIIGAMSLVGPRPLPPEYLPRYTARQARRHEVKPGITGWAQVNGRNGLSWEKKFELDVWYVDHCSLWLDVRILWMTLLKVLRREGVSQDGHATMPEFTGSAQAQE